MDLSFAFFTTTIFAILLTGISKSGFGGGLGVMSVPLMSLFVSPPFAAAVLMPILLAMDILIVARYRKSWSKRVLLTLLPGALIGLIIGAALFRLMDAATIKLAIGCLALVFVGEYLLRSRTAQERRPQPAVLGSIFGALSGFASFVAHAGGPPVKGYLLSQGLDKTVFVGTNTLFFFTLNAIKTFAYGALGSLSASSLQVSLIVAPFLFVGVFIGTRLHGLIDQKTFISIVYGFLALTGLKLIYDSVPLLLSLSA